MIVDYLVLTPEQDDAQIIESCEKYFENLAYVYLKYDETRINDLIKCLSNLDPDKEAYIREVLYSGNQSAIRGLFNAIKIQKEINSFTEEYVRINGMPEVEIDDGESDVVNAEPIETEEEPVIVEQPVTIDSEELALLREENKSLHDEVEALRSENDILQDVSVKERQEASEELLKAKDKISDMSNSIESLMKDLDKAKEELENYKYSANSQDVNSLLDSINELRQEKTLLKIQLDEKDNLIEKLSISNKAPSLRVDDIISSEIMTKAYRLLLSTESDEVKTIFANILKNLWNDEKYDVASIIVDEYLTSHIALHPINGGGL